MTRLIGTLPNQIPSNADLGSMAYCDVSNFISLSTQINQAEGKYRFPNALASISAVGAGIQHNETHNIGLIGEGVAHATDTNVYGIGLYGAGYTSAGTRCGGVVGEGHVSGATDTGSAIGVRGYALDVHSGGMNIGLYGNAVNGATNYALYMSAGDIFSAAAQTWTLGGKLTITGADIQTSGNLTIKPGSAVTPVNLGEMTFQATSNTTVTIKLKGSDGIVRTADITLAP
jgi:hypothetical protein